MGRETSVDSGLMALELGSFDQHMGSSLKPGSPFGVRIVRAPYRA